MGLYPVKVADESMSHLRPPFVNAALIRGGGAFAGRVIPLHESGI